MSGGAEVVRAFVADHLGGTITRVKHDQSGGSRQTFRATVKRRAERAINVVVRRDIGSGPFSGSAFSLEREASLLWTLEGRGLPAPRCLGLSEDGSIEILECLPGQSVYAFDSTAEKEDVGHHYVELIALLHQIDPSSLKLPHCPVPSTAQDHALSDLTEWEDFVERRRLDEPCPLLLVASEWLRANASHSVQRTVLLHGDSGPGNFLHQGGRVTGIIDWELAHFGDPLDDLAWWWFRERIPRTRTDLSGWYRQYAEGTGTTLDLGRLLYYRVFVLYRCTIANCADPTKAAGLPAMAARLAKAMQEVGVVHPLVAQVACSTEEVLPRVAYDQT